VAGERAEEERVSVDLDALVCSALSALRVGSSIASERVRLLVVSDKFDVTIYCDGCAGGSGTCCCLASCDGCEKHRERESSVFTVDTSSEHECRPNPATQTNQSLPKRCHHNRPISADKILEPYVASRVARTLNKRYKADLADHLFTRSQKGCLFATVVCTVHRSISYAGTFHVFLSQL
jgi:hypothetical protein